MREVTNEDVVKHASKKCSACRGSGTLNKWVYTDENHQERVKILCKCAEKRFVKAMGDRLVKQPDGVFMLKEHSGPYAAECALPPDHGGGCKSVLEAA